MKEKISDFLIKNHGENLDNLNLKELNEIITNKFNIELTTQNIKVLKLLYKHTLELKNNQN